MEFQGEKLIEVKSSRLVAAPQMIPNPDYVSWLEARLKSLLEDNVRLQGQVESHRLADSRRYRNQQDMLDYDD